MCSAANRKSQKLFPFVKWQKIYQVYPVLLNAMPNANFEKKKKKKKKQYFQLPSAEIKGNIHISEKTNLSQLLTLVMLNELRCHTHF